MSPQKFALISGGLETTSPSVSCELWSAFRANVERLKEQPKYPPMPEDEPE